MLVLGFRIELLWSKRSNLHKNDAFGNVDLWFIESVVWDTNQVAKQRYLTI